MSTDNPHIDHLVDDYLHDLLSPEDAAHIDIHCSRCPRCDRALREARRRLGLVRAVPPTEPSAELVGHTMRRISEHRQRWPRLRARLTWGVFASLAASLVLLFAAHIYYANLTPTTLDLVVLGQRELLSATQASLRIRLFDRGRGASVLAGVPVIVSLRAHDGRSQELARFTTDDQGSGSPRFHLPDWENGTYQLHVQAGTGWHKEVLTQSVVLKRSWKLMLSSDKPIYQPGQTIQTRALTLRRPDLKPVAAQQAVFTLTDPRGNILFKDSKPTSTFGIAATDCALASEIQEGTYTLACKVGDTESKQTIEIQRYVLPRFQIAVRPDRPYYAPGETVRLTIQSDYFFGKPVAAASVSVEVRTHDVGERVIDKLTGKTDDRGQLVLSWTVPRQLAGREIDAGDARLRFVATVTDTGEQKLTRAVERLVTTRSVRIETIPEAGTLVRGLANTIWVLVTRADGTAVPGVKVTARGEGISTDVRADERGVASFQVTPTSDEMAWTVRVEDPASGIVLARRHDRIRCGSIAGDFLVRSDRAVYQGGQSMTLTALAGGSEPIFLDLIKDGQTLLSEKIEVQDGKGEHTVDLPADLFGTVQMVAYRFTPIGLPVRKLRVLYITPPEGLKIQATLDQEVYQPGHKARLQMRLTDAQGKPTPGAISLAAVDEAVFAVLAQRPGMEQTFYNLEQELLQPVYALYPWGPGEEGTVQRDRALFASTSRQVQTQPMSRGFGSTFQLEAAGPHSLAVRSLPAREQEVRKLRADRLQLVRWGWVMLIFLSIAAGYAGLWAYLPAGDVLKIHGVAAIVLMGFSVIGITAITLLGGGAKNTFSYVSGNIGMAGAEAQADLAKMAPGGAPPMAVMEPRRDMEPAGKAEASAPSQGKEAAAPPRLRQFFPETLLWKPELITDDQGRLAPLEITLADSITTWRLSASAVAADGRLGGMQRPMKVFQPFFVDLNLPPVLTRGDEVGVPVVVYNYLDRPQTVSLTLTESSWFKLSGAAVQKLDLRPGEVRSLRFTLQVNQVGIHPLRITAQAGTVGDAIERQIEVVPDGKRIETSLSGNLGQPAEHTLDVPDNAIEGSVKAFVKIYPSGFSQVVEGLDSIFRMPYGCFEQTSSTTYPNVLALEYLRRNKLSLPAVEAKARQYIHLGYQRLVGFEVPGGGFDWYGRPPANVTLTAYGLRQFEAMVQVGHAVDANLLARTRRWLLSQRKEDGSWEPDLRAGYLTGSAEHKLARLATTAYVSWAVFAGGQEANSARITLDYLLAQSPGEIGDAHVLALVCNTLLALTPESKDVAPYLERLAGMARKDESGKHVWWERATGARTMFYGAGLSGQVETTALAALALIRARQHPALSRGALTWLVARKDPRGTWHSTQATVLALEALLAGTGPLGGDSERRIEVRLGKHVEQLAIPADRAEVMAQLDLSRHLVAGANRLSVTEQSKTGAGYQVVFRYHVPEENKEDKKEPLTIDITYDRTTLAVNDVVKARATVTNRLATPAPMVMLDLPIPPGFVADVSTIKVGGAVDRVQPGRRTILVYLRGLEPGKPLVLDYTLRATMPVKAQVEPAQVYEYYDPQKRGASRPARFTVQARP